jgi:hypothetical protein
MAIGWTNKKNWKEYERKKGEEYRIKRNRRMCWVRELFQREG